MARRKRIKLQFDEDSVNLLLQEIYEENHIIKGKMNALITKWESKIGDAGSIAALGDQLVKVLNVYVKNQDQKIILLKYLKEVVYRDKSNDGEDNGESKGVISDTARNELIKQVRQKLNEDKKGSK